MKNLLFRLIVITFLKAFKINKNYKFLECTTGLTHINRIFYRYRFADTYGNRFGSFIYSDSPSQIR